jgi:hypothetical protein
MSPEQLAAEQERLETRRAQREERRRAYQEKMEARRQARAKRLGLS